MIWLRLLDHKVMFCVQRNPLQVQVLWQVLLAGAWVWITTQLAQTLAVGIILVNRFRASSMSTKLWHIIVCGI